MENWWEAAPLVEQPQTDAAGGNWWDAAPLVEQSAPQPQADDQSGYGSQMFSGLMEGATGALGAPVDLMNNFVVKPAVSGVNALFGTNIKASDAPLGGSSGLRQGLAISPESDDSGQQFARRVSQSVGGAIVPLAGTAQTAGQLAAGLGAAAGGGVVGATAQQLFPDNIGAEIAGELLGGIGSGGTIAGIANRSARKAAERSIPSIEQLKQGAKDAYEAADNAGVVYSPNAIEKLKSTIVPELADFGYRPDLHSGVKNALDVIGELSGKNITLKGLEQARKAMGAGYKGPLSDFRKENNAALKKVIDSFDNMVTKPGRGDILMGNQQEGIRALQQARNLWQRSAKAEQIEYAFNKAKDRAGKAGTGGNIDNTIRQEIDKVRQKGKGFTVGEQRAMAEIANGTAVRNLLRLGGGLSPTRGGLPLLLNAGAALGTGGLSLAASGGGLAAKMAADHSTKSAVDRLSALIRSGGNAPKWTTGELNNRIIEALLASQAASQSDK